MSVGFSPALAQDPDRFRQLFFTGEKEIKEIQSYPVPGNPSRSWGKWIIDEIITPPFACLISIPLYAIAYTARFLHLYCLSTRCFILANYLCHHALIGQGRALVPTLNFPQLGDSDVYNRPSLSLDDPFNRSIRNVLSARLDKIQFNKTREGELCHGGCMWFIYLFLKSFEEHSSLPLWKRAYAVAKQFEYGQPKQAALLQAYNGLWKKLLSPILIPYKDKEIAYLVIGNHALVYMHEEDETLIWDPNQGLIEITIQHQMDKILKQYSDKNPVLVHLSLR